MGFPTVSAADSKSGTVTSNSGSWTLTYPTNLESGDLILAFMGLDGNALGGTGTWPAGWVGWVSSAGNTCHAQFAKKVSDGTETGNFSVTGLNSEQGCWRVIRIPAATWEGTLGTDFQNASISGSVVRVGTQNTSGNTNPNPLSLDPNNWATEDTLWIAMASWDGTPTGTGYPTNYTQEDHTTAGGHTATSGGAGGAGLAVCYRKLNASSEDPGTFTISASEQWEAMTFAVRGTATGTQYTQNLGGSVTGSGSLKRDTSQKKTGSITVSGAIAKATTHFKTGSITAVGSLRKFIDKMLGGLVSPAATLQAQRVVLQDIAGSVTPAGSLNKDTSKRVDGNLTPVGAIAQAISKPLAGSSTPSGVLTALRTLSRTVAGSIAASGAIAKQTAKSTGGSITPAGAIAFVKSFVRTFTASVTASGALSRSTSKLVAGSSIPAGSLATLKSFTKQLAGSITPSGAVSMLKALTKQLAGSIAATGSVARSISIVRGGSITPAGALQKFASLFRSGAIAPSGGLTTNQPQNSLTIAGSVTPSGAITSKSIGKLLTGSSSAAGSLAKTISIVRSGSITAVGVLFAAGQKLLQVGGSITVAGTVQRSTSRSVGGSIAPSGVLIRSISKRLGGMITASGNLLTQMLGAFVAGDARTYMQLSADVTAGIDPGVSTELLLTATARTWLQEDPS
jgi:hypothetical protein